VIFTRYPAERLQFAFVERGALATGPARDEDEGFVHRERTLPFGSPQLHTCGSQKG